MTQAGPEESEIGPEHDRKAEAAEFVLVEPKPVSLSGPMQGQVGWRACYRSFNGI